MTNTTFKIHATKEQLEQWYIKEKRSYRWIMKELKCNSARSIKRLLNQYEIPIRVGGEAVATQWINAEKRRENTSKSAKKHLKPFWGTQSKRPEVAAKISASKMGSKNPMWGVKKEKHPNWLGGKRSWKKNRRIPKGIRLKLIDQLGNKCEKCGSNDKLTIHHDPPWREVRSHAIEFLHLLCSKCHFHGPIHLR